MTRILTILLAGVLTACGTGIPETTTSESAGVSAAGGSCEQAAESRIRASESEAMRRLFCMSLNIKFSWERDVA